MNEDSVVAFVVDLTERKRAEAERRETERRYQEVQLELAHANRVATMGQLSASIAHEVNQPMAAASPTRKPARWLPVSHQIWKEAAINRIVATESGPPTYFRIRALVKKAPPRKGDFR